MGLGFLEPSARTCLEKARFVVLPIPYDITASWGQGARLGPHRILEASQELELFDEELLIEPYRFGIHTFKSPTLSIPPEKARDEIKEFVRGALELGKIPVAFGGDHSVTIGIMEAVKDFFQDFSILQLDAHTDLRESYQGTRLSHACVMRRIWEKERVIQAGIRSLSRKEWEFLKGEGTSPIWARELKEDLDRALGLIISRIKTKRLYITIDVDCLDPSVMPATGTPEPGGLSWFELIKLLKGLTKEFEIIGFDIVELSPIPGITHPDFLVARLAYKLIGYIGSR